VPRTKDAVRSPSAARTSSRPSSRKNELPPLPCVLAIGGLDPGGGAGILADARAISHVGAFATAAVAVLTVQSTSGMRSATAVSKSELIAECTEVLKHQRVCAIKVGALGSDDNARAVGDFLAIHRDIPAVVDTVMVPTRGRARLLEERAVSVLRTRVLPHAALVTANAPEAEVLVGRRVTRLDEAHDAALALLDLGCRAVLLKGGHLGGPHATDLLAIAVAERPDTSPKSDRAPKSAGKKRKAPRRSASARVIELAAPRIKLPAFHGGGCALASLVAARLATHAEDYHADPERVLADAARWAKKAHHDALLRTRDVGGDLRILFA